MSKELTKLKKSKLSTKFKNPKFYNLIILNDDFTSMEFVVKILIMFFNLSLQKATEIMLCIHNHGSAIVGTYPKDIAETLSSKVNNYSLQNNYPLKSIIKPN